MDISNVAALMKENKLYLKSIFESKNVQQTKKLIKDSSQLEADTLLQILYCLTHGSIPFKKSQFTILQKSRKHLLLHKFFETHDKLKKNLSMTLKAKVLVLLKFASSYKHLLYTIFVK
jgi:hypothetical protein